MKYNLLKSEFESRNILFLLIIIISFYQISVLNIDQLFYHIYPKLMNLASEKAVSFCNNSKCFANDIFLENFIPYNEDAKKKYICMVNNSLYLLINETSYKKISSNYSFDLNKINKYSINFHYDTEKRGLIYIINYISRNKMYFYEYQFNLPKLESYLIKTFIVNETNLLDDINCIIEDIYLKCVFYKKDDGLKLYIASFKIEQEFKFTNFTSFLDNISYEDSGSIIKLSYNLNELHIGLLSKNLITIIIYNFYNRKIISNFTLPINKSELFLQNEAEIYWMEQSTEILFIFKGNESQMKKILMKQKSANKYELNDPEFFEINNAICSKYNNNTFYFLVNNDNKYEIIQECIDDIYCKINNISNIGIISNQIEEKQNNISKTDIFSIFIEEK